MAKLFWILLFLGASAIPATTTSPSLSFTKSPAELDRALKQAGARRSPSLSALHRWLEEPADPDARMEALREMIEEDAGLQLAHRLRTEDAEERVDEPYAGQPASPGWAMLMEGFVRELAAAAEGGYDVVDGSHTDGDGPKSEEPGDKEQSTDSSEAAAEIHVKLRSMDGGTTELDVAPGQNVAEMKKAVEQQTGVPAYQQQFFLDPAEGEQLPDWLVVEGILEAFAELEANLGPDRTLQLSMVVDPSAAAFDDTTDTPPALHAGSPGWTMLVEGGYVDGWGTDTTIETPEWSDPNVGVHQGHIMNNEPLPHLDLSEDPLESAPAPPPSPALTRPSPSAITRIRRVGDATLSLGHRSDATLSLGHRSDATLSLGESAFSPRERRFSAGGSGRGPSPPAQLQRSRARSGSALKRLTRVASGTLPMHCLESGCRWEESSANGYALHAGDDRPRPINAHISAGHSPDSPARFFTNGWCFCGHACARRDYLASFSSDTLWEKFPECADRLRLESAGPSSPSGPTRVLSDNKIQTRISGGAGRRSPTALELLTESISGDLKMDPELMDQVDGFPPRPPGERAATPQRDESPASRTRMLRDPNSRRYSSLSEFYAKHN